MLEELAGLGINIDAIAQQLEDEGLVKFIEPFDVLLQTLQTKLDQT